MEIVALFLLVLILTCVSAGQNGFGGPFSTLAPQDNGEHEEEEQAQPEEPVSPLSIAALLHVDVMMSPCSALAEGTRLCCDSAQGSAGALHALSEAISITQASKQAVSVASSVCMSLASKVDRVLVSAAATIICHAQCLLQPIPLTSRSKSPSFWPVCCRLTFMPCW